MRDLSNIVSGMMLMVDKPLGWTSFDVVNKIRYAIRRTFLLKKIKVGHAGTLDPLASGLLIICTGSMTKQLDNFQAQFKIYEGAMALGATTPTYDRESAIDQTFPSDHLTPEILLRQAAKMTGEITQTPPVYSAIKKDGIPLYKLARSGQKVEVPQRNIQIFSFELDNIQIPEATFTVKCGKGTYIRSLVHEFGLALESGAHLTALRRTAIGPYDLKDAWNLDDLLDSINRLEK